MRFIPLIVDKRESCVCQSSDRPVSWAESLHKKTPQRHTCAQVVLLWLCKFVGITYVMILTSLELGNAPGLLSSARRGFRAFNRLNRMFFRGFAPRASVAPRVLHFSAFIQPVNLTTYDMSAIEMKIFCVRITIMFLQWYYMWSNCFLSTSHHVHVLYEQSKLHWWEHPWQNNRKDTSWDGEFQHPTPWKIYTGSWVQAFFWIFEISKFLSCFHHHDQSFSADPTHSRGNVQSG